jgi:hypothetical protein
MDPDLDLDLNLEVRVDFILFIFFFFGIFYFLFFTFQKHFRKIVLYMSLVLDFFFLALCPMFSFLDTVSQVGRTHARR